MINLFLIPIYFLVLVYVFLYLFYRFIYAPYKLKSQSSNIDEIILILKTIIATEIELYENNIFDKRGIITNANYENYYRDMTKSILDSISDEFFFKSRLYMTEEAIVSFICRTIRSYLNEKINELNNIE